MVAADAPGIAAAYRDFAELEVTGSSPLYRELALGVAADPALLTFLLDLPEPKRQPNLLFAAVRLVAGTAGDYADFRRSVAEHRETVVATMLRRRTQTNEPARCGPLYPLLASLPQPVALLEVGASAGLCLLPDRYRYEYNGRPAGDADSPVTISCRVEGPWAHPGEVRVAWRTGIDLNPLSVDDADDVRWLETLVWPGQDDRLRRLRAAVELARRDPPPVLRGDLNDTLERVASGAPAQATLVVYHSAVLTYLSADDRERFVELVRASGARWISQEAPRDLPGIAAAPAWPHNSAAGDSATVDSATFLVSLDGRPVGWASPHGGWLTLVG